MPATIIATPARTATSDRAAARSAAGRSLIAEPPASAEAPVVVMTISAVLDDSPPAIGPERRRVQSVDRVDPREHRRGHPVGDARDRVRDARRRVGPHRAWRRTELCRPAAGLDAYLVHETSSRQRRSTIAAMHRCEDGSAPRGRPVVPVVEPAAHDHGVDEGEQGGQAVVLPCDIEAVALDAPFHEARDVALQERAFELGPKTRCEALGEEVRDVAGTARTVDELPVAHRQIDRVVEEHVVDPVVPVAERARLLRQALRELGQQGREAPTELVDHRRDEPRIRSRTVSHAWSKAERNQLGERRVGQRAEPARLGQRRIAPEPGMKVGQSVDHELGIGYDGHPSIWSTERSPARSLSRRTKSSESGSYWA